MLLIYIMVVVLLIFGFVWLGILPQVNRASQLEIEITDLETKKVPIETAVKGLPGMMDTVGTAVENYRSSVEGFYPYMQTHEIDKMLTGIMINDFGLTVNSLSLNPAPELVMTPYYAPSFEGIVAALDDELKKLESGENISGENSETSAAQDGTAVGENGETSGAEGEAVTAEDEEVEEGKIPLYTSTVTITAEGTREKMQAFVDSLFKDYPSLRVTSYTISQLEGGLTLNLTCDFYMQLAS